MCSVVVAWFWCGGGNGTLADEIRMQSRSNWTTEKTTLADELADKFRGIVTVAVDLILVQNSGGSCILFYRVFGGDEETVWRCARRVIS